MERQTTASEATKHTCNGSDGRPLPFGRKAPEGECARCDELRNGAEPRTHAGVEAMQRNAQRAAQHDAARRAHFGPGGPHRSGTCGPVCTFGDW